MQRLFSICFLFSIFSAHAMITDNKNNEQVAQRICNNIRAALETKPLKQMYPLVHSIPPKIFNIICNHQDKYSQVFMRIIALPEGVQFKIFSYIFAGKNSDRATQLLIDGILPNDEGQLSYQNAIERINICKTRYLILFSFADIFCSSRLIKLYDSK